MTRLTGCMVLTAVLLCVPAAALAQAVPAVAPDQTALTAQVAALIARLAEARTAEANGQVSQSRVVSIERDLVDAEVALAEARGETGEIPKLFERQVALEQAEVDRFATLQQSGTVTGGALATAVDRLVAAKTRLAQSRGEWPDVKTELERLVSLREAEVARAKSALERGLVSGSRVATAEEELAAARTRLEEALQPPPTPPPEGEVAAADAPGEPAP
jgi:hypothetical protein